MWFSEATDPFFSICETIIDFWMSIQQFEELSSSSLGFGVVWSEGGGSAQCRPTDYNSWNHSGGTTHCISSGLNPEKVCLPINLGLLLT